MNLHTKKWLWTGRIVSIASGGFMAFDGIIHLIDPPVVAQSFQQFGYSPNVIMPLAIVELIFVVLYLIPKTSVLGAIFLTGYLGGAVDVNVRAGNSFGFVLFPICAAIALWAGIYLCDEKFRAALFC